MAGEESLATILEERGYILEKTFNYRSDIDVTGELTRYFTRLVERTTLGKVIDFAVVKGKGRFAGHRVYVKYPKD